MGLFDSNERKTYRDDNGYLRFKDSDRLVHRWIASKKIGRKLKRDEIVHHINMNKMDNDASNLYVCRDQREHEKIHGINNPCPVIINSRFQQRPAVNYSANNLHTNFINSEDFAEFLVFMFQMSILASELLLKLIWLILKLIWIITKFICKYLVRLIKYFHIRLIPYFINKLLPIPIETNNVHTQEAEITKSELLKKVLANYSLQNTNKK